MASIPIGPSLDDNAVTASGGDLGGPPRSNGDRRSASHHDYADTDMKMRYKRDRRSRSPDHRESSSGSRRQVSDYRDRDRKADREREERAKEAEAYKRASGIKVPNDVWNSGRDEIGRSEVKVRAQESEAHRRSDSIKQAKDSGTPQRGERDRDSQHSFHCGPSSKMDARVKLTGALTTFLSQVAEQASLQNQREAAKRTLGRRVSEFEQSRSFHEDFPSTAEAQRASKERAQKEFDELDKELKRKREGSLALIEEITDSVFSQSSAVQSEVQTKVKVLEESYRENRSDWGIVKNRQKQLDELYRASLKDLDKELQTAREANQHMAEEISILKSGREVVELKKRVDNFTSRLNDFPNLRLELSKASEQINDLKNSNLVDLKTKFDNLSKATKEINDTLNAQAIEIERLKTAREKGVKSLESDVNALIEADSEIKDDLSNLKASMDAVSSGVRTSTEKLHALEKNVNIMENGQGAVQDRFKGIETRLDKDFSQKFDAMEAQLKILENGQIAIQGSITNKVDALDSKLKVFENDQGVQRAVTEKIEAMEKRLNAIENGQREKVHKIIRMTDSLQDMANKVSAIENDKSMPAIQSKKPTSVARLDSSASVVQPDSSVSLVWEKVLQIRGELKEEMRLARKEMVDAQNAGDDFWEGIVKKLEQRIVALEKNGQSAQGLLAGLREDVDRTATLTGANSSLSATLDKMDERVSHFQEWAENEIEGARIGLTNLDFRMNNLSTGDLAKQILSHMQEHVRGSNSAFATIVIRLQEVEKRLEGNFTNLFPRLQKLEGQGHTRGNSPDLEPRLQNLEKTLRQYIDATVENSSKDLRANFNAAVETLARDTKEYSHIAQGSFAQEMKETKKLVQDLSTDFQKSTGIINQLKAVSDYHNSAIGKSFEEVRRIEADVQRSIKQVQQPIVNSGPSNDQSNQIKILNANVQEQKEDINILKTGFLELRKISEEFQNFKVEDGSIGAAIKQLKAEMENTSRDSDAEAKDLQGQIDLITKQYYALQTGLGEARKELGNAKSSLQKKIDSVAETLGIFEKDVTDSKVVLREETDLLKDDIRDLTQQREQGHRWSPEQQSPRRHPMEQRSARQPSAKRQAESPIMTRSNGKKRKAAAVRSIPVVESSDDEFRFAGE